MKNWKSCLTAALALAATTVFSAEPLLLQWGTIDTSGNEAQAESAALKAKVAKKAALARARKSAAAEERAAYIVQFPGPVTEEWRTWLESSTQVRGYLPEFAYLVWATASEMETIAANENVFWTGEWKKDYKTVCVGTASPAKTTASATADEARWMQVGSLLTGDDGAADLRARLEALPAEVRSAFPRLDGVSAVANLTDAQIDEVASWPDVEWIEPKLKARLFNDKAALTNMMNVTNAWKAISSGGLGLTGSGQIVAVADTGCDKGSLTDIHADFSGRVLAGYGWTNGAYKASASWADVDAHGTHVCGSVLGSGAKSSGQFRGMAYEAQLVMQGMWEDLGGLPDYTGDMLKQAYTNGARIHSDSWGYGTNYAGKYVYDSIYADGYMWTNQNFIMVIAAGNDGIDANSDGVIDAGSVSCPGTAKNCLCVGAAENYRDLSYTWGGSWSNDYPADPIKSDKISQTTTPQGLAAFSGRGPTKDGRFKPDIVAPGTDVISVRGRMAEDDGWGIYSSNTNYLYEGGTSMATPLTSGALALVRQWLVDRKGINEPMAALMKALLINGARDMTPGQYGTGSYKEITARPDRSQGFGHVNLYNSLEPGSGNFLHFVTNKLTTGTSFTTNIVVGQANGKYLLTLVWQDYPGSSGGSKNLVNDLDLTVTSPSGTTIYYPNNLSGLDHTNNVEFIEFTATETGTYSVKVNGYSVSKTSPNNGQPFALVMRGPKTSTNPAAPEFSSTAASASGVTGETFTYNFASLLTAGYPAPTYRLHTSVSSYNFDTTTGVLTFTPATAGDYNFTCIATNTQGSATCALTVTITPPPPGVPAGLALSDVGTTSFTASWNAAANAESYRVDVVKGTSFEAAAGDPVLEANFSSISGWTLSGTGTYTGSGYYGAGSPSIKFDGNGDSATSPDFGSGVKLQFWALGNGGSGSTFAISGLVNGSWTDIETVSIANGGNTYEVTLPSGTSQVKFDFTKSVNCALDDVVVYGPGAEAGEYVSGWSNATVNATSANVTGLQPGTDYAVRVRAENGAGTSDNSATATTTTAAGDFAPVWGTIPAQSANVGDALSFTPATYVSGSPAPTVTLSSTTASSGYSFANGTLSFTPASAGTYTFTFLASNSLGTASATLTVTATEFVETKYALCVGINSYASSLGASTLSGCVNDAAYFYTNLVTRGGWTTNHMTKLTNSGAKKTAIRKAITNYAAQAVAGDTFIYQHSSHGGQNSGMSVFLCAYDDYYEDTELAADLAKFASGVKVVVVVDACHSGGLFKGTTGTKAAKAPFNLAERVTALMEENRAQRLARGERGVEKTLSASEIGWVTAADYTESSLDGGYYDTVSWMTSTNEGSIMGGVFLGSFTWGWWNGTCDTKSGYGDNDGYADAYECWKIAYDCCTKSSLWGSDAFTPQYTNLTVLRSVELGWVGNSAPSTPPAFSSATSSTSVYQNATLVFDFSTLLTAGTAPTYLLTTSVSSSLYTFSGSTLRFTPTDTGTYTFKCVAANAYGSATNTLTVTVTLPPVTVPVLTVSDETATTALASWTACDGVSSYTLQLASDDQFTTGGTGDVVLEANFSNTSGWTLSGTGTYTGSGYYGAGSPSIKFDGTGDYVISPDFGSGAKLQFWALGNNGSGSTFAISGLVNGSWTDIETVSIAQGGATYEVDLPSGTSQIRFDFTKSVNCALDDVVVTAASGEGSIISTDTVNGISHTFTGLDPVTTYYARVKGNDDWSSVVSFTTQSAGASAPVLTVPQDSYSVLVGAPLISFAVTATGTPEPRVTATCTEGAYFIFEDNEFLFEPAAIGTYHFVFTATNSEGSDSKTVTVTVAGAAASISVPQTSYAVTVGDDVNFTVNATGAPEPTVTATCTEGAFFIFENKEFLFSPETVGTYHFVFTATNSEGSDSETVTVVVSPPPVTVPELTITDVTDTTALATWTACDDVSTYTLQLSTNDFATASSSSARDVTTLLTEHFTDATGSSTAAISDFDAVTDNDGWEGSYVYVHDGSVRISSSKNTGDIESPWLTNATAGATVTLAFGSVSWTNASTIVNVTVTEDGSTYSDPVSFALTESMTSYTTNFTVSGTRFRVRWAPSAANKRFFLDDVVITSATSGGGDDPGGGSVQTFTVTGTSYTFTDLTPDTAYAARVKGNADWSEEVLFHTPEEPVTGTAPSWSPLPTPSVVAGSTYELDLSGYVSGDPVPVITMADTDLDAILIDGEFAFTPVATGTATFTFTASNDYGTATATLTVTVTGSAPVWQPLPAQTIAVGEDCELYLTSYVSGTPTPAISLTTGGDIADFDPTDDNYFYFTTSTAGTYSFVFTASNVLGTVTATLSVTVTGGDTPVSDYDQWIADNNYPEEPESAIAENGHTYYENYIADIDPTSTNELEIVPELSTGSTFTVTATSESRYYQLIYTTNLMEAPVTTNLGWGATGASGITFPADWYGSIRVLLEEP